MKPISKKGTALGPRRWHLLAWLSLPAGLILAVAVVWRIGPAALRQAGLAPAPTLRPALAATLPLLNTAEEYFARGDADFDAGDFGNAIADYGHAFELRPDWAAAYNNQAYTYMKLEDYAPALADLNEAIRLRPDYVYALLNRGDIHNYYYDIDYDLAIADYDRALAADPSSSTSTSVCGHRAVATLRGQMIGFPFILINHACPSTDPSD